VAVFSDSAGSLIGRVRAFRPNISSMQVLNFLNDRVKQVLDVRPIWADLMGVTVLSSPAAYQTGTITTAQGSNVITGAATAWPVNDVVNTNLPNGVQDIGYQEITPATMANIAVDTWLYVDAAGTPETVCVVEVSITSFYAKFQFLHNANATITSSSLAGLQFRTGNANPVFTVTSVQSSTQLTIDIPWGAGVITGQSYQILKMYFTIAPDLKEIRNIVDPAQGGLPIEFHISQQELDWRDPQRSSTGPPLLLADKVPTIGGTMQYELWPAQTIPYQIPCIYTKQWPELRLDNDRPPWFISPMVFYHGALADALRFKAGPKDPYHNPPLANEYERRFIQGMEDAKNANESKAQQAYTYAYQQIIGRFGGPNYWISHEYTDFSQL
jgi:hypothetical protein